MHVLPMKRCPPVRSSTSYNNYVRSSNKHACMDDDGRVHIYYNRITYLSTNKYRTGLKTRGRSFPFKNTGCRHLIEQETPRASVATVLDSIYK